MSKLAKTLYLALALLLSQTAVALHDIHCLDEAHVQICQICAAHDHSADCSIIQPKIERLAYAEKLEVAHSKISPFDCDSFYLSRAPPQTL